MKLNTIHNRFSLIALLSLGLACSPLVVSADDDNRGWRSQYQQDRGKPHHETGGYSDSCRTHSRHGYKKGHHKYSPHRYNSHHANVQQHYRGEHHYDRSRFLSGWYSSNLAALFYD